MVKYYTGERDIREEKSPRFCVLTWGFCVSENIFYLNIENDYQICYIISRLSLKLS